MQNLETIPCRRGCLAVCWVGAGGGGDSVPPPLRAPAPLWEETNASGILTILEQAISIMSTSEKVEGNLDEAALVGKSDKTSLETLHDFSHH